jgi:hypothetical protein
MRVIRRVFFSWAALALLGLAVLLLYDWGRGGTIYHYTPPDWNRMSNWEKDIWKEKGKLLPSEIRRTRFGVVTYWPDGEYPSTTWKHAKRLPEGAKKVGDLEVKKHVAGYAVLGSCFLFFGTTAIAMGTKRNTS